MKLAISSVINLDQGILEKTDLVIVQERKKCGDRSK